MSYDQDYQPSVRLVAGTATVQDLTYGLDAAGNITGIADLLAGARSQSFQYDPLDRLTQAQGLYGTYAYGYDAVGNRLSRSLSGSPANFSEAYAYAPTSNRLQSVVTGAATRTLGYTAQGNVASDGARKSTAYGFSYDNDNRMSQVAFAGKTQATYLLNFRGERVLKTGSRSSTAAFHYDRAGNLLAESDGRGNLVREYVYLDGVPIALIAAGAVYFIHPDHLGTPQKITDASQAIVWDGDRACGRVEYVCLCWRESN